MLFFETSSIEKSLKCHVSILTDSYHLFDCLLMWRAGKWPITEFSNFCLVRSFYDYHSWSVCLSVKKIKICTKKKLDRCMKLKGVNINYLHQRWFLLILNHLNLYNGTKSHIFLTTDTQSFMFNFSCCCFLNPSFKDDKNKFWILRKVSPAPIFIY